MTLTRPRSVWPVTGSRSALLLTALFLARPTVGRAQRPQEALDQLVAADRRFAAAGEKSDLVDALTAMFADSVVMPLPGGLFARTREEARASLIANPANRGARITWSPVRAVVSGDGQHGFTAGYMTLRTDTVSTPLKYLAYWVRGTGGWRVAAYKRARAGASPPSAVLPFLVLASTPSARNPRERDQHLQSLIATEKQFSDSSQKIGLGPAFAIFGRDDAINMGGPANPGFVVSASEISKVVGGGPGSASPVSWSADFALVAPSGDLGVTFGLIRRNEPVAGQPPTAFFTIWSRPGAQGEWRYIAE